MNLPLAGTGRHPSGSSMSSELEVGSLQVNKGEGGKIPSALAFLLSAPSPDSDAQLECRGACQASEVRTTDILATAAVTIASAALWHPIREKVLPGTRPAPHSTERSFAGSVPHRAACNASHRSG